VFASLSGTLAESAEDILQVLVASVQDAEVIGIADDLTALILKARSRS